MPETPTREGWYWWQHTASGKRRIVHFDPQLDRTARRRGAGEYSRSLEAGSKGSRAPSARTSAPVAGRGPFCARSS